MHATWVHLPDGAQVAEVELSPTLRMPNVDDQGLAVGVELEEWDQEAVLFDPIARSLRKTGVRALSWFDGAVWLDGTHVVVANELGVRTLDLGASLGAALPWPTGPFVAKKTH